MDSDADAERNEVNDVQFNDKMVRTQIDGEFNVIEYNDIETITMISQRAGNKKGFKYAWKAIRETISDTQYSWGKSRTQRLTEKDTTL